VESFNWLQSSSPLSIKQAVSLTISVFCHGNEGEEQLGEIVKGTLFAGISQMFPIG
jgi:hypothetical protein